MLAASFLCKAQCGLAKLDGREGLYGFTVCLGHADPAGAS